MQGPKTKSDRQVFDYRIDMTSINCMEQFRDLGLFDKL